MKKLNEHLKNFLTEQFDNVNKFKAQRSFSEKSWYPDDELSDFNRDYARVIYSTAFRRQQGKMQLLEVNGKAFYRNRLTHSFEVAQIARAIVDNLKHVTKLQDRDADFMNATRVVETASLVHDIGNPPFGHHGERVLDQLTDDVRYEGNAQGIRILRTIEKKSSDYRGLNLTYRTLAGIIKYNVSGENKHAKKFLYEEDYKELNDEFNKKGISLRTLDVQIVDLADEIAYCAHDLEDTLAEHYFTIEEFIHNLSSKLKNDTNDTLNQFKEWVGEAREIAEKSQQSDDFNFYFRRALISKIVDNLVRDIGVIKIDDKFREKTGTVNEEELGFKTYGDLASSLKTTVFNEVTKSDNIILYENMGTKVLKGLYEMYTDESYNRKGLLLPIEYRWNDGNETDKKQKVLDYIGGMMDTYAIDTYKKHFGKELFEYEKE
ncbi:dNTP triphosphohydrolase [Streptococcus anginosus]|nr:dNTP triphosphohydrolase [Streptococcus anginosus]MCW1059635.1 dNTP triphosphohydrolase [Streptococcus anginosus]MDU3554681.1 dNTP triphosphohydrolase [Streptococcus anginosus]MDX5003661.1 dNTP triphosphohydrolase [Streptococcus anginosus]MDX5025216.1 dNTP triphosphohydrolase [Streptococcus anginosus]MDX5033237.1 dNTP triphosphohydrolase [Streptococcus anginosus]